MPAARLLLSSILLLLAVRADAGDAPMKATLVSVKKIADDAPHSAFTDLLRWNDQFVCAFRQGRGHVSADGRVIVLTSPDGETWTKAAELKRSDFDLRDASLSVTPHGKLMLIGGASPRPADGASAPTGSFVAFSDDARIWTEPEIVSEPGRWLWRTTWHDSKAYGVSYAAGSKYRGAALMVSTDGRKFTEAVPQLFDLPGAGRPTEAVIRFAADDTAYCLQRRDGPADQNSAFLGVSRPPYDDWQWQDLGIFFGGPNLIATDGGQWIAAGRIVGPNGPKTHLAWLDAEAPALTSILELPSGGDTSYPGLAWHDGRLWVSYYSSHEGKTSIYLAQVRIEE